MKVSVLICTYNRGSLIQETLHALIEKQDETAEEIVVVNGGGRNDCSETLQYWMDRCSYLKVLKTTNINLANSRNLGLKECSGDLILMTDDDARPFPDWISKMKTNHLNYSEAGVIGGEVVDASGDSLLSQIADVTVFPKYRQVQKTRSVPGVNCSYKKEVIKSIGEQDTTLFRGEDVDYNWRAILGGWDVIYVPEIKVYHQHRSSWNGLFRQHHMYGRAYYLVRKKWPDMYCAYPHHINSIRQVFKGIYFMVSPLRNAWIKSSEIKGFISKLIAFPIIMTISYYWIYGVIRQKYSVQIVNP